MKNLKKTTTINLLGTQVNLGIIDEHALSLRSFSFSNENLTKEEIRILSVIKYLADEGNRLATLIHWIINREIVFQRDILNLAYDSSRNMWLFLDDRDASEVVLSDKEGLVFFCDYFQALKDFCEWYFEKTGEDQTTVKWYQDFLKELQELKIKAEELSWK